MASDVVKVPRWVVSGVLSILVAGIIGGMTALFTATSWAAKLEEKLESTTQLASITSQQYLMIAPRMDKMEERVKSVGENIELIRVDQRETNRKLDTIIRSVR